MIANLDFKPNSPSKTLNPYAIQKMQTVDKNKDLKTTKKEMRKQLKQKLDRLNSELAKRL